MLMIGRKDVSITAVSTIPVVVLAVALLQSSVAQADSTAQRPPSFTYYEAQAKARSAESSDRGSAGSHEAKAVASAASDGKSGKKGRIGEGRATFYQHPGRTASGERYNPDGMTAAHRSLPLGSKVRVVNEHNGRSAIVRINDRTNEKTDAKRPYVIDLSRGSARAIGITSVGQVALYRAD